MPTLCHNGAMADHYLGSATLPREIEGSFYALRVHIGRVNGAVECVGIDVRAFRSNAEDRLNISQDAQAYVPLLKDEPEHWPIVDSKVLRSVKLAEAISRATEALGELRLLAEALDRGEGAASYWVSNPPRAIADLQPAKKKRGARTRLTDDLLASVVVPAWLNNPGSRTESVRKALEDYWGELVTIDQAKKAVSKARSHKPPLLPPTSRNQQGAQPK